jgi:hypothetical protein
MTSQHSEQHSANCRTLLGLAKEHYAEGNEKAMEALLPDLDSAIRDGRTSIGMRSMLQRIRATIERKLYWG